MIVEDTLCVTVGARNKGASLYFETFRSCTIIGHVPGEFYDNRHRRSNLHLVKKLSGIWTGSNSTLYVFLFPVFLLHKKE